MRIFVGTLYSGENELEACTASIHRQSYKNFQHFVFSNLPNKEAHVTLFRSFLDQAGEFDILVKVDADMVLTNDTLFEKIVENLKQNDAIDLFAIAVHDFFSNQLIWGLNAFRNTVRWDFDKNTIFVDIPELPREKMLFDDTILAPAATHCQNPSLFQAFHYGVHRGLKSIQPKGGSKHWETLEQIRANFEQTQDVRVGLAVLGAELAYAGKFRVGDLDYTNSRMNDVFIRFASSNTAQVKREIQAYQLRNWGFLPASVRRKILISKTNPK